MKDVIQINNLSKKLGEFCLEDISFSVKKGYITGFIGPNGAGKTSTIQLILNSLLADSGSIQVFGLDNVNHTKEIKQRIGFVSGEDFYPPTLTLKTIKKIIAPFYEQWDEALFNYYTKKFQIPLSKRVQRVSTGTKRKFSLALALSHHAELLILDEPTSGLDPLVRTELMEILEKQVREEEKTVLFSTHITSDLEQIADFITFINNGKIVLSKTKEELLDTCHLVKGPLEVLTDELRHSFIGLRESKTGFEALTIHAQEVQEIYGSKVILGIPSLEEIFIYYARRNEKCLVS